MKPFYHYIRVTEEEKKMLDAFQRSLDLQAPGYRTTDPKTSRDAAASMKKAATAQCAKVLVVLRLHGELGAEQIGDHLGMDGYAVRKRLAELCTAGVITPTGKTRKTRSGRSERVWEAI
jgi:predicted transcriptional regulator